jgi:leucyl-tRNA synthetase
LYALLTGREAFLTEVWKWVDEYGGRICDQLRRIGSSVDWSRKAFTMDDNLSVSERRAAVSLISTVDEENFVSSIVAAYLVEVVASGSPDVELVASGSPDVPHWL